MSKTWQLPRPYLGFPQKTLILNIARGHQKWYRVRVLSGMGAFLKELSPWRVPDTEFCYSDREGFQWHRAAGSEHASVPGSAGHDKEHYLHVFANFLTVKLQDWWQRGKFTELIIFLPADFPHILEGKLPPEILNATRFLEGNVAKTPLLEIAERIFEMPESEPQLI